MEKRFPSSTVEANEWMLADLKKENIYLLDGNIIDILETIYSQTGVDILDIIDRSKDSTYLFSNEVGMELMNRRLGIKLDLLPNHLINVEGAGDHTIKENRFVVKENGELVVKVVNKLSQIDHNLILLCQNHSQLILVSNDRKLIKSGS